MSQDDIQKIEAGVINFVWQGTNGAERIPATSRQPASCPASAVRTRLYCHFLVDAIQLVTHRLFAVIARADP